MKLKNRKAQEEMIGFAMIIILVAVIILVFVGISLARNRSQNIDTVEADSFMQSMLQYTTSCQDNFGYVSMQNLILSCAAGNNLACQDGKDACQELDSTLSGIMSQSWVVGQGSSIKGYSLNITSNTGKVVLVNAGNVTSASQGTSQELSKGAVKAQILLRVYS